MAYYLRFIERFPNVHALANAPEEDVLKTWQGLGYYSRARNLHKAAQFIVKERDGAFPTSYVELLKLPGVGPYTASAVSSFCAEEERPVVDGNVQRVASRWLAMEDAVDTPAGNRFLLEHLNQAMEGALPSTFNQAIMELGALVCTPKSPNCFSCPVAEGCRALALNRQADFPKKRAKTKVQDRYLISFILTDGQDFLLRQRDASSIWKNMADLPSWESDKPIIPSFVSEVFTRLFPESTWSTPERLTDLTHILSHRKLHVQCYVVHLANLPVLDHHSTWPLVKNPKGTTPQLPIPRMVERLLENWSANGG